MIGFCTLDLRDGSRLRPPGRIPAGKRWSRDHLCGLARPLRFLPRSFRVLLLVMALVRHLPAQGPMPEEGATLFPRGAFLSFGTRFTSNKILGSSQIATEISTRPTHQYENTLVASWAPWRDFQLIAVAPYLTKRLELPAKTLVRSGFGDAQLNAKFRILRLDSSRGTSQISFEVGAKLPTGETDAKDAAGNPLSLFLQPGTGSTDWKLKLTGTYTGLFGFRRLVADSAFSYLLRTEGVRQIHMGNESDARLWIHFRPLQTRMVGGEWFIGPDFNWMHIQAMRVAGAEQPFTGNDIISAGLTTYISPRGGLVFWANINFPIAQDWSGAPYEQRHRLGFGITKQFVMGR